jgi:hypothetical protein
MDGWKDIRGTIIVAKELPYILVHKFRGRNPNLAGVLQRMYAGANRRPNAQRSVRRAAKHRLAQRGDLEYLVCVALTVRGGIYNHKLNSSRN